MTVIWDDILNCFWISVAWRWKLQSEAKWLKSWTLIKLLNLDCWKLESWSDNFASLLIVLFMPLGMGWVFGFRIRAPTAAVLHLCCLPLCQIHADPGGGRTPPAGSVWGSHRCLLRWAGEPAVGCPTTHGRPCHPAEVDSTATERPRPKPPTAARLMREKSERREEEKRWENGEEIMREGETEMSE